MDMKNNTLEFDTVEDVEDYIMSVPSEPKLIFDIYAPTPTNSKYIVKWQEQKYYVAQDGKTFPDETWITQDGKSIQVQDLEVEHLRNIIRMIIRNSRKYEDTLRDLLEKVTETNSDDLENYNPPKDDITYH